jgi:putative effector of murein hydrolase
MESFSLHNAWIYLSTTPLLGLTLTLIAYQIGQKIYVFCNKNPLCNPVLIAVVIVIFFY